MKNFIIYNKKGGILRTGLCQDETFRAQANECEFVMEGKADGITQKIIDLGQYGIKPMGFLKIVDKTPEEIEAEKPPEPKPISHEKQIVCITNEQWQAVQDRLRLLETKA